MNSNAISKKTHGNSLFYIFVLSVMLFLMVGLFPQTDTSSSDIQFLEEITKSVETEIK